MIERSMGASLFIGFEFCKLNISLKRKREQIDMGTPSNIIWQGISKLCAKFHAFITLVTIEQKLGVKPPDYKMFCCFQHFPWYNIVKLIMVLFNFIGMVCDSFIGL